MKFAPFLFGLLVYIDAHSQPDTLATFPKTKIEIFSDRLSTLYKKEYVDVGRSKSFTTRILTITDLTDNTAISAFTIEWINTLGGSVYTYSAFLDTDELDDLSKALSRVASITAQTPPNTYTEYDFTSRSGFEFTVFVQVKEFAQTRVWRAAIENYRINSRIYFNVEELGVLQTSIQTAKSKL